MAVLKWRIRCAIKRNRKHILTAAVPALLLFLAFYVATHHGEGSLGLAQFSLASVLTSLAVFSWALILQLNLKSGPRGERVAKHEKSVELDAPAHALVIESDDVAEIDAPRINVLTRTNRQLA